ncbi:MAG: nucleotidyltransferase family protein [Paludibacteraceae bacterium]|nr:nucleotidyltransferase family protein [Paludibacteraceae bacterium]
MKAMIFAAGLGTRLKPLTDTMPKALLPLAGKTLLQWQIERLQAVGITEIVVNIHHLGQQIIDYLNAHDGFGCTVQISDERESLLETGGGLLRAFDNQVAPMAQSTIKATDVSSLPHHDLVGRVGDPMNEPVLVCNVDILSNIDLGQLIAAHRPDDLATVVVSNRETQRYLLFSGEGELRGWTNKKTGEYRPASAATEDLVPMAFSGMQIVEPAFFRELRQTQAEKGEKFSLIDAYLSIVTRQAGTIRAFVPRYYKMMDVGKIDQLEDAERFAERLANNTNGWCPAP